MGVASFAEILEGVGVEWVCRVMHCRETVDGEAAVVKYGLGEEDEDGAKIGVKDVRVGVVQGSELVVVNGSFANMYVGKIGGGMAIPLFLVHKLL